MEKVFDNVLRDTSLEKANNWKEEKVEDLIEIKYGKDHKKLNEGNIPCFGSGGLMRYVDAQLYDGVEDGRHIVTMDVPKTIKMDGC